MSGIDRFNKKNNNYLVASARESSPLSRSVSASNMSRLGSHMYSSNALYDRPFSPVGLSRSSSHLKKSDMDDSQAQETERLNHYNLNITDNDVEAENLQRDKNSRFYSTKTKKDLESKKLLPYKIESIRDQYKYLSHVVTHIYIAIKGLDLKGNVSISVADLEKARDALANQHGTLDSSLPPAQQLQQLHHRFQQQQAQQLHDEDENYESLVQSDSEPDDDEEDEDDEDEDEFEGYDSDEEQPVVSSTPVTALHSSSAPIIGLKYWTKELKNMINLGLAIPVTLSSALIKTYFAVCMSRGQSVDVSFYTDTISILAKESDSLHESGLRLDWRPIYEEFAAGLDFPDKSSDNSNENRIKRMYKLANTINQFFEEDCVPSLMESIMSKYSHQTIESSFLQMAVLLPTTLKKPIVAIDGSVTYEKHDIRHYLPLLFSCWTTQRSNKEISCILVVILNIVESVLKKMTKTPEIAVLGKYGIFTQDQFNLLINQLLMTSKISQKDDKQSKYVKLIIQIIVNSITSQYALKKFGIMDMLKTYGNSIQTLIHPSNTGAWSVILSQIVKTLALTYHERLLDEKSDRQLVSFISEDYSSLPENVKLTKEVTSEFIKLLKPLIHLGIQSKIGSCRKRYIKALETLCFMEPEAILDDVLLDIYTSFDSVNSIHRINVVLRELSVLARFMANNPVYRVHIPRLLSMLLPGIDSNDPEKTILTIRFVKAVTAVVPVVDLTEGSGDGGLLALDFTQQHLAYLEAKFYKSSPNKSVFIYDGEVPPTFEYDPQLELEALNSATSSFQEFIKSFSSNCFKYLEYAPNVEGDEGIETKASVLIGQVFDSLLESVSDELFEVISDEFYSYITDNVKHLVAIIFSNIAELIVRRDPKNQFSKLYNYLFPQVKLEIEQGAGTSRTQEILSKDARLIWHYKLLCGAVLGAGEEVCHYLPELQKLVNTSFSKLRGEAAFTTGMLLNSALSSLTLTRLLERRLISKDWLEKNGGKVTAECWGGFQFDTYRFNKDNLAFNWYMPSERTVETAVSFFTDVSESSVNYINEFIQSFDPKEKISLDASDTLAFHLISLDSTLNGVCTLFDPHFKEEDIHKQSKNPLLSFANASTASLVSMHGSPTPEAQNLEQSKSSSSLIEEPFKRPLTPLRDQHPISEDQDIVMAEAEITKSIDHVDLSSGDSGNVDTDFLVPNSELPSGLVTPSLGGGFDAVDPSLTNRDSKMYSFGYYYDRSKITNLMDPTYIKLHKTRELIGKTLHQLISCLGQQDGSLELIGHLIQCVSGWLKNVGYYSSSNPIYIDNIHMADILDIFYLNAPYTRTIVGARAAIYHCNRMSFSRSTRLPTTTDKVLIRDLISLSASSYRINSYHATVVLISVLNRVLNCSGLLFGIFKDWETALANNDNEKLKNILRVFHAKKFRGLPVRSFHYLSKYEDLLTRSIQLDENEINIYALKLYGYIKRYIRIPKSVCNINLELVDSIRPPDFDIENKIEALKLAKSTKRKYMSSLINKTQELVLKRSYENLHWKQMLKTLDLLTFLQSDLETGLSSDVISLLAKSVNGVHPAISKKCIIWLATILDITESKASFKYNVESYYSLQPLGPNISTLTNVMGKNVSQEEFFTELKNFENPSFFIDNKFWVPVMSWKDTFKVVNTYVPESLGFNKNDSSAIADFGKLINKDWLLEMINLHVEESESHASFLPGFVYFLSSVALLSIYGFTPHFKLTDLFEVVEKIYKKDEKQTHVAVTEIFSALLLVNRRNTTHLKEIDEHIGAELETLFSSEITQSSLNIWKIFCWWIPAHFDMRRVPKITAAICDFEIERDGRVSPFIISSRITLLKAYMSSTLNRFHKFDELTDKLFDGISHPYQVVAQKSASALYDVLFYTSSISNNTFENFIKKNNSLADGLGAFPFVLPQRFEEQFAKYVKRMLSLVSTVKELTPQQIAVSEFMYTVRGFQFLYIHILKTAHGGLLFPYVKDIVGLCFELDSMKDACQLAGVNQLALLYLTSAIRFDKEQTSVFIDSICDDHGLKQPTLYEATQLVYADYTYYTVRFLTITADQRLKLVRKFLDFLYSPHLSVREQSAGYFSSLIHSYVSSDSRKLVLDCLKEFRTILKNNKPSKGNKKLTVEQTNLVHGATLGLGALVDAFPYQSPPPKWLPKILSLLAGKCSAYDGVVARTAKDTLSKFKKTRQDTWHIDSKFFTEEQLEDLEGVLWKSYFI